MNIYVCIFNVRMIGAFILNYLEMPLDLICESMSWMYYTNERIIDMN